MGKGVKIVLVCLEFVAFAAGGYFIGENFLSGVTISKEASVQAVVEEPVEVPAPVEEVVLSPVPVLLAEGISKPVLGNDGKYSFDVAAAVENGDALVYILFADAECNNKVADNADGKFKGLQPVASQTYYVCAQNAMTGDYSDLIEVKGFVKPEPKLQMYNKITKEELDHIFNVAKSYDAAGKGFSHRMAPGYKIVTNGLAEGERKVSDIAEICTKTSFGMWASVSVTELQYDAQNRLTKLVITVNY